METLFWRPEGLSEPPDYQSRYLGISLGERYYFYGKLHRIYSQGTEMITTATASPTIIFVAFYRCSVEYAVCSVIKDENTSEQCRLSQYDTEHYRTLQAVTIWHRTLYNTAGCHNMTQNTIEHGRLSRCDTEHYRTLQAVTMWHRTLYNTAGCHNMTQNTI